MSGNADIELFDKIKEGDFKAFELLFERYYQGLCNFTSKYFQGYYINEDVVQDVFISIWENRKKISISGSAKSYLYSSVKNRCLSKIKSEAVRLEHSIASTGNETKLTDSVEKEIELQEFRNHLAVCIDKLPPRCKEVFVQSRFDGLKQEKIAQAMNVSLNTIKVHIGKALRLVRDCLQPAWPDFS